MRIGTAGTILVAVCVVLAGCSGGAGPEGPTATASNDGTPSGNDVSTDGGGTADAASTAVVVRRVDDGVDFYVSDRPATIDEFAHLNVTITRVGFQQAGGGWIERDVDGRTVDLTRLQGANATRLTDVDVPNGTYNKVFAYVSDVNATLDDGTKTRVKLPSEKLQLQKSFTVGPNASVDFVFDIAVHEAGKSGKYILRPVVSQSGTDVPIEPVDDERELNASVVGNVTRGGNATLQVTRGGDPVANATVSVDDERVGTTGDDGRLTVSVPDREEFELTVEAGDREAELEATFREREDEGGEEGEEEREETDGDESDEETEEEDGDEETENGEETEEENEDEAKTEDREEAETETEDREGADNEPDDAEAELNASFAGNVTRGENVTVVVTRNGSAVANATVVVNDERAGATDANGEYTLTVPDAETLTVEIGAGEAETELEVEFEDGPADG